MHDFDVLGLCFMHSCYTRCICNGRQSVLPSTAPRDPETCIYHFAVSNIILDDKACYIIFGLVDVFSGSVFQR